MAATRGGGEDARRMVFLTPAVGIGSLAKLASLVGFAPCLSPMDRRVGVRWPCTAHGGEGGGKIGHHFNFQMLSGSNGQEWPSDTGKSS